MSKEGTFVFKCGHRFCIPCVRAGVDEKIRVGKFDSLKCFAGCETKLADEDFELLYRDFPESLAKYKRL